MTVKFCFTGFVKHSKALGCLLIYRLCYLILAVMDSGGILYFVSTFRYSPSLNRTKFGNASRNASILPSWVLTWGKGILILGTFGVPFIHVNLHPICFGLVKMSIILKSLST